LFSFSNPNKRSSSYDEDLCGKATVVVGGDEAINDGEVEVVGKELGKQPRSDQRVRCSGVAIVEVGTCCDNVAEFVSAGREQSTNNEC